MVRQENQYLREYVEYYKSLGFDNIVIYDNNRDGEEHVEEVLNDYIVNGYVIVEDYRNRTMCQPDGYTHCYNKYGQYYDWIAVFDCDEFLTLPMHREIHNYLNEPIFNAFNVILVNWMIYGDSNMLENDGRPVLERFTEPVPFDQHIAYSWPEDFHTKSIVRTKQNGVIWPHTHRPILCPACNAVGKKVNDSSGFIFVPYDFTVAYLRHYSTKTADEYAHKMMRGFADQELNQSRIQELIETRFFRTNKITKEKVEIFKNKLNIDMSYLLQ